MKDLPTLLINGRKIKASPGDTLLDAGLSNRVVIPHDCCTGQCSTCRVRVYDGEVDDEGTREGDTVLACQATVSGDAVIEFDEVPFAAKRSGTVTAIERISPDIVEVAVTLSKPLTHLPGQYVKVSFAGFPARDYSPTFRVDGTCELNELIFHIRGCADGVVSSQLGRGIGVGHRVRVRGPFGNAFFRKAEGRIVLVATGTGWAPIWSVARAARYHQPQREMVVVVGARDPRNLYMQPSLEWLSETGVQQITMTCTGSRPERSPIRSGRPTVHLPRLQDTDTVFVAGAPEMVSAVEFLAGVAGATCHADPFLPATRRKRLGSLIAAWARQHTSARLAASPPQQ
ncbi:MAG TPA: 2Fe-2S iron-sulfur cluster-binding protein [Beijerinckiaceae bacterium]|nr:2Fe-2S iron-sulfur cluster-binding protein [Beijerinckiaceae bacterium]